MSGDIHMNANFQISVACTDTQYPSLFSDNP